MRKVDLGIKVTSHAFMIREFAAIVIGDGMDTVLVGGEAGGDGTSYRLGWSGSSIRCGSCPSPRPLLRRGAGSTRRAPKAQTRE